MTLNRKGQGLPVNMIIIVALGLLVLVIAGIWFAKAYRDGGTTATSCSIVPGAVCVGTGNGAIVSPPDTPMRCDTENGYRTSAGNCPKGSNTICCFAPDTT